MELSLRSDQKNLPNTNPSKSEGATILTVYSKASPERIVLRQTLKSGRIRESTKRTQKQIAHETSALPFSERQLFSP